MNDTPEISYERSLTRSLMLLHHCSLPEDSFESKMLQHTRIPGTLPLSTRSDSEDPMLVYDITSLLSVEKHYENRRIVWQDIAVLIDSLSKLLRLLLFALAPNASPDFQRALTQLLAWVLERIDYSSDPTVVLAYRLHKESCREYCSIADLQKLVRIHTEKGRQQSPESWTKTESTTPAQQSTAPAASRPGLSADGIFRYQPQGSSLPPTGDFAANTAPSGYADTRMAPPPAAGSTFSRSAEENPVLPQSPHENKRHEATAPAANPGRPVPPPILGDDWTEDDDTGPDYRFPASRSAHELNPEDYAIDLNTESDGNASGNLFSFLRLKKERKKEKATSLNTKLQTKRSENSLRTRLLLCLILMLAIPTLTFLLKGPSLFRRLLPVILIVEVGIAVLTALDCLMLRMPEEEES